MMKILLKPILVCSLLSLHFAATADIYSENKKAAENVQWRQLFSQLFTWNLIKDGDTKGRSPEEIAHRFLRSVYYYDPAVHGDFNGAYESIMRPSGDSPTLTSYEAFQNRESVLGNSNLLFTEFLGNSTLKAVNKDKIPGPAKDFAEILESSHSGQGFGLGYFDSNVGQKVMETMSDYLFVVIPGFGSHTMEEFSYAELVEAANSYYGRLDNSVDAAEGGNPYQRPRIKSGQEVTYANYQEYYTQDGKEIGFDIVHPMGIEELGYSMGSNEDAAIALGKWILGLWKANKSYKEKNIILLGYSKGAPIAHDLVHQVSINPDFSELKGKVKMIVTVGGVVQGAIPAQSGLEAVKGVLSRNFSDQTFDDLKDMSLHFYQNAETGFAPLWAMGAEIFTRIIEHPMVTGLLDFVGLNGHELFASFRRIQHDQKQKILTGVQDMTPFERIKWNLQNLRGDSFNGVTVFNLSMLTNMKDILTPGAIDPALGPQVPPQIVPQLVMRDGLVTVDWKQLSLDNMFLHLTSIGAFSEAPGGLFDTQVAWLDTKSMPLDNRPLRESLTEEQLADEGLKLEAGQADIPRKELVREQIQGASFVDLGEVRGTHWDPAFRQVYKPPQEVSPEHYVHIFPRSAFVTALVETLTLYKLVTEEGN